MWVLMYCGSCEFWCLGGWFGCFRLLVVALGLAVLCIVSCGCCRVGLVGLVADSLELWVSCRFGCYCANMLFPVLWFDGCCFVF